MKPTATTMSMTNSFGCSIFLQTTKSFLSNTCFSIQSNPIKPHLISCSSGSSFPFSLTAIDKKTHNLFLINALVQEEYEENLDDQEWEGEIVIDTEEEWVPSEDCKVYVGNLPYDIDSEQLAGMFQKAGVVERAEVYNNIYDFFQCFLIKI